jgi:hypothetical protein
MVLGELVLQPLPVEIAERVESYARALGIEDRFVHVARDYAQGAFDHAWEDLRRSGFVEGAGAGTADTAGVAPSAADPELEARWLALAELPVGSLGRAVSDMYAGRGFTVPGAAGGPSAYLAQHDFVHVLGDYGTNLKGELEVFALIGRADPDPKGFAWLATLIGLFETGFIEDTGFFERDVREHNIAAPGMDLRIADAIRRGKVMCEHVGKDLFEIDFHALAPRAVDDTRETLHVPPKAPGVVAAGSPGVFDRDGMSAQQQGIAEQ